MIEAARRAAGLSQRRLAEIARTQQSSVSEYESRRKSPTLEVVERLVDAADHELVARRMVFWDPREDPEVGSFYVPDRLWSVPVPLCFSRVRVFPFFLYAEGKEIWDLSDSQDRIEFYEVVLCHGFNDVIEETVDGALLVEAWSRMTLPDVVREAWQPLIDAATSGANRRRKPRDPAGVSAEIAAAMGIELPKQEQRKIRARDGTIRG